MRMNPPRIAKYFRYQHPALPLPAAANWLAQSKRSKRILFVGPNGLGGHPTETDGRLARGASGRHGQQGEVNRVNGHS